MGLVRRRIRPMRGQRFIRALLVALTAILLGRALQSTMSELPGLVERTSPPRRARAPIADETRADPDSLSRAITRRNPFRMDRGPAAVAFDVSRTEGSTPAPSSRPTLAVSGVILGIRMAAIVEGLPGTQGPRLLSVGERFGEFVLRSASTERVVVATRDTTWTLPVRGRAP